MYADWNHQYYRNDIKWNIRFGCLLFSSLKMQFTIFWFFFITKWSDFVLNLSKANSELQTRNTNQIPVILNSLSSTNFLHFSSNSMSSIWFLLNVCLCHVDAPRWWWWFFFSCDMMYNDIQCRPKPILDLIRLHWICVCVWMFALVCIS